jgi:hypothetical protein
MHEALQIPYVYDYITKSYRQQAEVIQNHENENENVLCTGQGEARHRKYKRLNLAVVTSILVKLYAIQSHFGRHLLDQYFRLKKTATATELITLSPITLIKYS